MIGFNKIKLSVNKLGQAYVDEMKKQLEQSDSIATRDLYNSIKYSAIIKANRIDLKIVALPYLYWIDKGRKASGKKPPLDPLLRWVEAKSVTIGKTPLASAFAVQKILATKDTKPKNIFSKTRTAVLNNKPLMDEMAKSAAKDIGILAINILKDLKSPTIKNT
jgi:hypothetical protein